MQAKRDKFIGAINSAISAYYKFQIKKAEVFLTFCMSWYSYQQYNPSNNEAYTLQQSLEYCN